MEKRKSIKPRWLTFAIPGGPEYTRLKSIIEHRGLNTVCLHARCPNIGHCFSCGTATFLILGSICTRNCRYCAISQGKPEPPDQQEPGLIAESIKLMGLSYAVITSVTRDDLPDQGAGHFSRTIRAIRSAVPQCGIEPLIPDFRRNTETCLHSILDEQPSVVNHNIEVTRSHFRELRPLGDYDHSLKVLEHISRSGIPSKTGLMIGFGESTKDIMATLRDIFDTGCRLLTIGQYLKSKKDGFTVQKYYHPSEFEEIRHYALSTGFTGVMCGPLVRSSYHAADLAVSHV